MSQMNDASFVAECFLLVFLYQIPARTHKTGIIHLGHLHGKNIFIWSIRTRKLKKKKKENKNKYNEH
jgi:hypothetical protein